MPTAILRLTDFSTASRPAFHEAIRLAKRKRRPLVLVHVLALPDGLMGEAYISPEGLRTGRPNARSDGAQALDRLVDEARAKRVRTTGGVLEGIAHEQIARAARAKHAEMIVMGTHGRSGFKRFVTGSAASRVLTTAPCPVLIVRGR